jgi:membrane-associated PAP2 superfamily phosphatase
VLAVAALLILALGRCTEVDLALADSMYDARAGAFPWRDAWLTVTFNHRIVKAALTALAALFIAAASCDAFFPQQWLDHGLGRLKLRVIACAAVLVPLAVGLLKQASDAHCPWDLARYGGTQPYTRLFGALSPDAFPGHCLPAGHASTALWMVSLAVLWLPGQTRKARDAAVAALALGCAVGWLQQMRGAHFLTHTLWSMWIACAVVLALVAALQAGAGRPRRAPARIPRRAP